MISNGLVVRGNTLDKVWHPLLQKIMTRGQSVHDERNSETLELTNILGIIENPLESTIPSGYPFVGGMMDNYKDQLLNPNNEGFAYTYGARLNSYPQEVMVELKRSALQTAINRIFPWFFKKESTFADEEKHLVVLNQISLALRRLKECAESRRAISVTWYPRIDAFVDEVPCLIYVDFKIREGKLLTTAMWRSHDIFSAYPANFFALLELSKYAAKQLDIGVGDIGIHSISAHVYKGDWDAANAAITGVNYARQRK